MHSFHQLQSLALHTWCEASKEGVLLVDPAGTVCLINPRLQQMLRLDTLPVTMGDLLRQSEAHAAELCSIWPPSHRGDRTRWGMMRTLTRPQTRLSWQQTPLIAHGELMGVLTVFEDTTHHGQLDLAKQSFLSMISHDLRTPLSTILGFAELLYNNRGELSDKEQEEFLEHIIKNANHLSRYTQIALDIMYLEADLQSFDLEPVSLEWFVEGWLSDAVHRFPAEQLVYQNGAASGLLARISPAALHRILYILVEFALEESPAPDPVQIRLAVDDSQAHIIVQHRAPALDAGDAATLFRLMHPRDLSEVSRPQLHRMQLYVASLLAERQQGCLTLSERRNGHYQIDLVLPLASAVSPRTR